MARSGRKSDRLLEAHEEAYNLQKFAEKHNGFDRLRERGADEKDRAFEAWLDETEREHNARKGRR